MKTIMRRGAGIGSFLLLILLPGTALAQVQITEIMYDIPGSDDGREWVEVTNTGSETIDIGKYKLLENGTNHGLKLISGNASLVPGSSAIIAANATKFAADNPNFSGTLFDSAFALSNTGESLVLKNASSSALDTASYTAAEGANGEGGSLHLVGSGFTPGMPNAGIYPGEIIAVPKAAVAVKKPKTTLAKSSTTKTKSTYSPTQNNFSATQGASPSLPSLPAIYLWIMGAIAVVLLGIAGIFFAFMGKRETSPPAAEFKIE